MVVSLGVFEGLFQILVVLVLNGLDFGLRVFLDL